MATILASYDIDSPELAQSLKVQLAEGLDSAHLDFIDVQWAPVLKRQYDLALLEFFQLPVADQTHNRWQDTLGKFGAQDQHWDWRNKSAVAPGSKRRILSLLNATDVEAAMMLLFGKTSRDPATPLPIVYVDYVAVAPWNRKVIQHPQRFKNLGTMMLGVAVAMSIATGLDGRCGLHSLPQSEGFYRQIGMTDFGIDTAYSSLRYFEFNAVAARTFVK